MKSTEAPNTVLRWTADGGKQYVVVVPKYLKVTGKLPSLPPTSTVVKADWEKKTLLPLLQKMYGPKLKLLTPKLAKKFVGHTVHCVFGQRWMDHNKGGVADRKSAISLIQPRKRVLGQSLGPSHFDSRPSCRCRCIPNGAG